MKQFFRLFVKKNQSSRKKLVVLNKAVEVLSTAMLKIVEQRLKVTDVLLVQIIADKIHPISRYDANKVYTHAHKHTFIYIYIYIYAYMC